MSDSDEMEIDVSGGNEEREVPDDSICPTCQKSTYVGETISCETCMYWFHFECVGVTHNDECVKSEDVPYFCPACSGKTVVKAPKSGRKPAVTKKTCKKKESGKPVAVKETPKPFKESARKAAKNSLIKPVFHPVETQMSPLPSVLVKSPTIKLKISISKQKSLATTQNSPPFDDSLTSSFEGAMSPTSGGDIARRKRNDSEEEEEKWLDAVESGNLHTVDEELKRIRDPKLMTARQRAMVTKKADTTLSPIGPIVTPHSPASSAILPQNLFASAPVNLDESGHMSLDFGGKKKIISEEIQQEQRAIKSQKRKELELVKREEDKKKTMDRLLLKKDSKATKLIKASSKKSIGHNIPKWTYKQTLDGATFSLPQGVEFPISPKKVAAPLPPVKCSVRECQNIKRYSCSKSGKPVCSLACYQKNLSTISV